MILRLDDLLIVTLLFFFVPCQAQEKTPVAAVMFYNLENLYDAADDTLKQDEEFQPEGGKHWSGSRLYKKLTALSKVIVNTGTWEPPAVIGFCEVENRMVLERLVRHPPLKSWNYRIIHKDSPDKRGIDVAAIYRPDLFDPLTYRYFSPVAEGERIPETREILYISGILAGTDTLHLFFNHWPSRYGGMMETRPYRKKAAARVRSEVGLLQGTSLHPRIIIMGDFNDQPGDESMANVLGGTKEISGHPDDLVNLAYQWEKEKKGTLKYQSQWNIFDQIIVSGVVLDSTARLFSLPEDARILDAPFLLEKDEKFTGMKLKRTYQGYQYKGGFSDHLPVILMLRKRYSAERVIQPAADIHCHWPFGRHSAFGCHSLSLAARQQALRAVSLGCHCAAASS